MADTFEIEIATPERLLARGRATEAQIPLKNGYIGVLPEHAPLLSQLGAGRLTYTVDGRAESLIVGGGYVEVLPDYVRILATRAERAGEIDVTAAQTSLRAAQDAMNNTNPTAAVDPAVGLEDFFYAQARVDAVGNK